MSSVVNRIRIAAAAVAFGSVWLVASAQAQGKSPLIVIGTLTDEGAECQALRGDDGRLYTLTGDLGGYSTGDRVRVRGRIAEISFCQQGATIDVRQIRASKRPRR